jgi:hypothetical protein
MAVQNTRAQVIKKLNAKKGKIKEVTSQVATRSFLSDAEVMELLELEEEVKSLFVAKLTRCVDGNDKNGVPYIILNFVITDGEHRGVSLSKYLTLDFDDQKRLERELKTLCMFLQNLGKDTTEWDDDIAERIYEACDELTAEKPSCRLALSKYVSDQGKEFMNMNVVGLISATTDDEEESEDEPEEEKPVAKAKAGKAVAKPKAVSKKAKPEPEVEEESDDEESDDTDYSEWIGYECSFVADEETGETVEGSTTSYDFDSNLFTVEDAHGDQYEVYPDDLTWAE